jgi:hypothetical protein
MQGNERNVQDIHNTHTHTHTERERKQFMQGMRIDELHITS